MGWGTEGWGGVGGDEGDFAGDGPSLANVSPGEGSLIGAPATVAFDLVSGGEDLTAVVWVRYPARATAELIYDSTGLTPLFRNQASSVGPVSGNLRFTLARTGGWPDSAILVGVSATDSNGVLVGSLSWLVAPAADPVLPIQPAPAPTRVDQFGVGLALPFRWGSSNDFVRLVGPDLVNTMVAQVLGTKRGELRWRPSFGASLDTLRHRGNTRALDELARVQVERALGRWVPQVRVLGTVADPITDATRNQLVISTAYQLGNGQAQAAQALV